MPGIRGIYSDGKTSRTRRAVLRVDAAGRISVAPEDPAEPAFISHVPADLIVVASRLGIAPRVVTLPTGATFTTGDHEGIDHLLRASGRDLWQRVLPVLERSLPLATAASVVAAVVIWLTITVGVPALAKGLAFSLPVEVERNIGQGTLDLLDEHFLDPSELPAETVDRLATRFGPILERHPHIASEVLFRRGKGLGANAFALPSGVILFTDELVLVAENDDQLQAVLYHEIGHLEHRHMLRRSIQGSILTVLSIFVTGDVSGINELVAAVPALVIDAAYSRDFEREADDFALAEMARLGMSVRAFGEILALIESSHRAEEEHAASGNRVMDFLRTHPGTPERIEAIRAYASERQ